MCLGGIRSGWHSPPGATLHRHAPNSWPEGPPKAQERCTFQRTGGRGGFRKLKRGRGTAFMVLKYVRETPGALAIGRPYHEESFQVSELSRGVIIAGVKWYPGSYGETNDYAFKVVKMYVVTVVKTSSDLDGDIGVFAVEKHDFCGVSMVPGVRTVRTASVGRRFVLCNSIRHLVTLYRDDRNPSLGTIVRVKDTTELAAPDVYVD